MNNEKKFAIILLNDGQYEICNFTDLMKFKNQRSSQRKHNKCLFIKKCNKETVQLIGVHCNYQILNELMQNMKADIPQVKIEDLKKDLHKFISLKEIEKPNYNTHTSVLTDVSEMQLDSSACTSSVKSVTLENSNNSTLEDEGNLDKSETVLRNYSIFKSSSTKCILRSQSNAPTLSFMNSNKSLMINEDSILLDEDVNYSKLNTKNISLKNTYSDAIDEDIYNVTNIFDKVPNNKPTIISNVPFSTSILVLPNNEKQEISLNESDLLSKSQISIINDSLELINDESGWKWNENVLIVPQCEHIENEQLEKSTFELEDWNNNEEILKGTLHDLTEKTNSDESKQLHETKFLVNSSIKHSQNNDDFSDSHSEYIPSEHSSEEDDKYISNNTSANNISRKSSFNNSGLNISLTTNIYGKSSRNDEEMYIESAPSKGSKRVFRKHFCLFCKTWQSKISRHLERKHKNEKRVKDFSCLPKQCNERRDLIDMLRKEGDFYYNVTNDVNSGELIVCRRPAEKCINTSRDFIACPKCKGFYNKLNLRHHTAHCIDQKHKGTKVCPILSRQIMGRYASQANNILRQIVMPRCREDRIIRLIRYDRLIMEHGNKLCLKYPSPHHHDMIRQRLRQLGRFLLEIKQHCQDIDDLTSVYHPKYYGICIDVINILAGFDISTKTYKVPSLATSLGTLLKTTGKTLISLTIFDENVVKQKQVENFLTLLNNEYGPAVNKVALETQQQLKRKKKIILPSINDIKKLDNFLKMQRVTALNNLKQKFSFKEWLKLSESTLISIQLFNRRRAGEMERTLIEDYKNYQKIDPKMNTDGFNALSSECQKIAMEYVRFTIRGKLNRTVSVLLDSELQKCVELILQYRRKAGVSLANPYVFGIPNIDKRKHAYLKACDLMRKFSIECGAVQPETLRGTTLRKHVATLGVNLNLTDIEITDLANFMGHEEKIHREHYRMPVVHREILRMSRLLQSASGKNKNENDPDDKQEIDEDVNNNFENDTVSNLSNCNSNDFYSSDSDTDTEKFLPKKKKRSTSPYGKYKRVHWNETEKKIVLDSFGSYISKNKLPSLHEIQELIKKNPIVLKRRTAVMIKAWLMNQKQKLKSLKS